MIATVRVDVVILYGILGEFPITFAHRIVGIGILGGIVGRGTGRGVLGRAHCDT
jgi:hypothetical protein